MSGTPAQPDPVRQPTGLCSAHRDGEDPACDICYPARPDPVAALNQWGFRSFASEEGVREHCRKYPVRSGGRWRIWRLADGTFDYTSTDVPRAFRNLEAEFMGYENGAPLQRGRKAGNA